MQSDQPLDNNTNGTTPTEKPPEVLKQKLQASTRWLVARIYEGGEIPDNLKCLFEKQTSFTLAPGLEQLLSSGSYYAQAAARVFHDNSLLMRGFPAVLQKVGFVGEHLDQMLKQLVVEPFDEEAHLKMIDALMTEHVKSLVSVQRVVTAISIYTPIEPNEEPYDSVDALLFWVNKVCALVRDIVEQDNIPLNSTSPNATIPEMEDLYDDISDGACLASLLSFYSPFDVKIQSICFDEPIDDEGRRKNLKTVSDFCASHFPTSPFHFDVEDLLRVDECLHTNVNAFLADLFKFFEASNDEEAPKDLHSLKVHRESANKKAVVIQGLREGLYQKNTNSSPRNSHLTMGAGKGISLMSIDSLATNRSSGGGQSLSQRSGSDRGGGVPVTTFSTMFANTTDENVNTGDLPMLHVVNGERVPKSHLEAQLQIQDIRRRHEQKQQMISSQHEQRRSATGKDAFFRVMTRSTTSNDDKSSGQQNAESLQSQLSDNTLTTPTCNDVQSLERSFGQMRMQQSLPEQPANQSFHPNNAAVVHQRGMPFSQSYHDHLLHRSIPDQQNFFGMAPGLGAAAAYSNQPQAASGMYGMMGATNGTATIMMTPKYAHQHLFNQFAPPQMSYLPQQLPGNTSHDYSFMLPGNFTPKATSSPYEQPPYLSPPHQQNIPSYQSSPSNVFSHLQHPSAGLYGIHQVQQSHFTPPNQCANVYDARFDFPAGSANFLAHQQEMLPPRPPSASTLMNFHLHHQNTSGSTHFPSTPQDPPLKLDQVANWAMAQQQHHRNSAESPGASAKTGSTPTQTNTSKGSDTAGSPLQQQTPITSLTNGGRLLKATRKASLGTGGIALVDTSDGAGGAEMTDEMQARRQALLSNQLRRKEQIAAKSEEREISLYERRQSELQKQVQAEQRRAAERERRQRVLDDYRRQKELDERGGANEIASARASTYSLYTAADGIANGGDCSTSMTNGSVGTGGAPSAAAATLGRPRSQCNLYHMMTRNPGGRSGAIAAKAQRSRSNLNTTSGAGIHPVPIPASIAEPTLRLFARQQPKSNRPLITNAIVYSVFPGAVSNDARNRAQAAMGASQAQHFLVLFRDHRCQYRGLYTWDQFSDTVHRIDGTGPRICNEAMMTLLFKYDSGAKRFSVIPTKSLSPTIDGFAIADHFWQKTTSAMRPGVVGGGTTSSRC